MTVRGASRSNTRSRSWPSPLRNTVRRSRASRSRRPVAPTRWGASQSPSASSVNKTSSPRSGHPGSWRRNRATRCRKAWAASVQRSTPPRVTRTCSSSARVTSGPGSARPSRLLSTSAPARTSVRLRRSSRSRSQVTTVVWVDPSPTSASTSARSNGAASRIRPSAPPRCSAPRRGAAPSAASTSATARNGAEASGSISGSQPPPPSRRRNRPPPRAWAMRSGWASATKGPRVAGSTADCSAPTRRAMSRARRRATATAGEPDPEPRPGAATSATRSARSALRSDRRPPRTSRSSSTAATTAAGHPCPCRCPSTTMRASRGCSGRSAIARPTVVGRPLAPSAPSAPSRAPASDHAAAGGWSGNAIAAGSLPHTASSSASPARSTTEISGSAKRGRSRCSASDQSRRATPGPSRPARPARWSAEACDAGRVTSLVRPVAGS